MTPEAFESLIARARQEHDCSPGASSDELAAAEQRLGCTFPEDLKKLFQAADGIRFWAHADHPCRLLSTVEIATACALLRCNDGPASIIAIIELQGGFVGIDLDPRKESFGRLIDCSHETFPFELFGICDSLHAMLRLHA